MTLPGRRWGRLPASRSARGGGSGAPRGAPAGLARPGFSLVVALGSGLALVTVGGPPARAQVLFPTTTTTAAPTTTTTAPATTTTRPATTTSTTRPATTTPPPATAPATTAPPPAPEPDEPQVGPDPAPAPPSSQPGPAPGQPPSAAGPVPAGGSVDDPPRLPGDPPSLPTLGPGELAPGLRQAMNAVRRSGPNDTRRLLAALAPLRHLGMTEQEVVAAGFGRFPVGGRATFSHDWLFPRYTPEFHLHKGTDIFAATGTPVRAPADGILKLSQGGAGGLAAYVYEPDGTYYYMAHLSAFVPGQKPGQPVKLGQVVGYVGDSGNALGSSPHVHFELHPAPARAVVSGTGRGRTVTYVTRPVPIGTTLPAVDPKATLDRWLRDAIDAVPRLVAALESRPRVLVATGITRRLADGRPAGFPAPVGPSATQLLWASSVNPAGGAVRLAEAAAVLAATEINWEEASRTRQALEQEHAEAQARAAAILAPLTPSGLLRPVGAGS